MKKMSGILMKIMMPMIDKLSPTCDVITKKISESMDHPISLRDRFRIRFHILFCTFCNRYRRQLLAIRDLLGAGSSEWEERPTTECTPLPADAKERIKESLRKSKDN